MIHRFVLLAALFATPLSADPMTAHPVSHKGTGMNCAYLPGTIVDGQDTVDGETISREGPFLGFDVQTEIVPDRLGIGFGFHLRFADESAYALYEAQVSHPPMGENGTVLQTWTIEGAPGFETALSYSIEDDFERVPGPWTFRLFDRGRAVFEGTVTMLPEGMVPGIAAACDDDPMS